MRVLLDECLRRLKRALSGHEVRTVPEAGWAGKRNGELLRLASEHFDAFVTLDQNLQYQQNLKGTSVVVIVLECRTSRFDNLLPLVPQLIKILNGNPAPGTVVRVGP